MTANIFDDISSHMPKEVVQTLHQADDVRIERIISHGHASAPDFWYDQPQHEWVVRVDRIVMAKSHAEAFERFFVFRTAAPQNAKLWREFVEDFVLWWP